MAKPYAKSFYNSAQWEACRSAYVSKRMQADGGVCERCRLQQGREVHHVIPITVNNVNDPNITLNHDNLKLLCKDCHFQVHRKMILEAWAKHADERITMHGCYCDSTGQLVPIRVIVVWGAPGAGKSRYVDTHREPDDIVVDLDKLQDALGRLGRENRSNRLPLARMLRDKLYRLIAERDPLIDAKTVWIIAGLPERKARERLIADLRAEAIYIDATLDVCREHIMSDPERTDKMLAIAIAEKYLERLER